MKAPFLKLVLLAAGIALLTGCQKEVSDLSASGPTDSKAVTVKKTQEHLFKGEFNDASYQLVPGPGWVPYNPAPAWYPGVGEGHATLIGKSTGFVNMYVTMTPTGPQGSPAPVKLFFSEELAAMGLLDKIPDATSILIFDKAGNSIAAKGTASGPGAIPLQIVSETRVLFSGMLDIIGGTGKFAGATGHYTISGYFNPMDFGDAGIEVKDGTIIY